MTLKRRVAIRSIQVASPMKDRLMRTIRHTPKKMLTDENGKTQRTYQCQSIVELCSRAFYYVALHYNVS